MRALMSLIAVAAMLGATGQTIAQDAAPTDAKAAKAAAKAAEKHKRELVAKYGLGPYPDEITAYVGDKPEALRPLYRNLYTGGERNAVLNFQRLGLAAMESGEYKAAEWAFDRALERIEAIYANNAQAAAARSLFHNESNKDFKGEPYERSMAYYYRGLLYLRQGDFGNARASLKQADYMDTLSETEVYKSDFAIMNYMIGWTHQCEGNKTAAAEAYAIAAKAEPGLMPPATSDDILFIAELGNGPVKARDAAQEQKLLLRGGAPYQETAAAFLVADGRGSRPVTMRKASSVNFQATTRGGRAFDGVLDGKAAWKDGTSSAGDALILASAQNPQAMGPYGNLIGLGLKMFSSAVKTKADTRAWDGLPDVIMVGTAESSPDWNYKVQYLKGADAVDMTGTTLRGTPKKCSVVWANSRPMKTDGDVVGDDVGVAKAQLGRKPVQEKNRLFRASLTQ